MKIFKDIRTYFIGLLIGCVCWFSYYMISYQILPTQYLIPALLVVGIISAVLAVLQFTTKKTGRTIGKVFIILLCALLTFVTLTYKEAVDLFDGMSHKEDTDVVSVVVRDKSPYNAIEDLDGKTFAYMDNNDTYVIQTIEELGIEEEYLVSYKDISLLVQDLLDKKVDSILLNEAFRSIIEDEIDSFTEDTRVIYSKEYKTVVKVEEPEDDKSSSEFIDFVDKTYNDNIDVTQDTFSIYVTGIDTYGSISTRSRSDVNMIVTVNPKTKEILLTSIPRDYYVPFKVLGGARDKLTHSGLYGPNETKGNIQNYFGIYLPYYVRINFSSLVNIVDSIGGIDVYSSYGFTAMKTYTFHEGMNHLTGKQALYFSRERKSLKDGDGARIKNQAKVIQGIINKVCSPEIINNYSALLKAVNGTFHTDITDAQIMSLIRMQLSDMSSWSFSTQSVYGKGTHLYSPIYGSTLYMNVPNDDSVRNARDRIASMYE